MFTRIKALLNRKPNYELTPGALRKLENPKWRSDNSKWRWAVFLSAGLYGGIALLIQGLRAKSRRMQIIGYAWFILFFGFGLLSDTAEVGTPLYDLYSSLLTIAIFFVCGMAIWATIKFNSDVLVWKAMRDEVTENWVADNLGIAKQAFTKPIGTAKSFIDGSLYSGSVGGAPQTADEQPITVRLDEKTKEILIDAGLSNSIPSNRENFEGILEINKSDAKELSDSKLFTVQQLDLILSRRSAMPFKSLEDLRLALDLKPHELSKLSKVLRFSFESDSAPGSGRILDV